MFVLLWLLLLFLRIDGDCAASVVDYVWYANFCLPFASESTDTDTDRDSDSDINTHSDTYTDTDRDTDAVPHRYRQCYIDTDTRKWEYRPQSLGWNRPMAWSPENYSSFSCVSVSSAWNSIYIAEYCSNVVITKRKECPKASCLLRHSCVSVCHKWAHKATLRRWMEYSSSLYCPVNLHVLVRNNWVLYNWKQYQLACFEHTLICDTFVV